MTDVGAQIKAARLDRHWSQRELGERVGCHQQTIDKIEHGAVRNSRYLLPILECLGMARVGQRPAAHPPAETRWLSVFRLEPNSTHEDGLEIMSLVPTGMYVPWPPR